MADYRENNPFSPLPESFDDDPKRLLPRPALREAAEAHKRWWTYHGAPGPAVGPVEGPQEPQIRPRTGEIRAPRPRPSDAMAPVSEALAPFPAAQAFGYLGAETVDLAYKGKAGQALANIPELLLGMPFIPGAKLPGKGGKAPGGAAGGPAGAIPRELDNLGFYSQALEAAKGLHRKAGPPEGFMNDLKRAGVKNAEIEATKLGEFLAGKPNVTREELIQHLRDNRTQVRETGYGAPGPKDVAAYEAARAPIVAKQEQVFARIKANAGPYGERPKDPDLSVQLRKEYDALSAQLDEIRAQHPAPKPIRWKRSGGQDLLLDPDNPTNRESVVHMPVGDEVPKFDPAKVEIRRNRQSTTQGTYEIHYDGQRLAGPYGDDGTPASNYMRPDTEIIETARHVFERGDVLPDGRVREKPKQDVYREPHFPDVPNYLFHLRTGQYKDAQGRNVLLGDELQSTRAQAIRDQGPENTAKLAEMGERLKAAGAEFEAKVAPYIEDMKRKHPTGVGFQDMTPQNVWSEPMRFSGLRHTIGKDSSVYHSPEWQGVEGSMKTIDLLRAEMQAEKQKKRTPGHPLVNDMSQVNLTGLRRLLQQGVHADVDGIALTPGDLQNQRYNLSKHISGLRYDPELETLHYAPVTDRFRNQWEQFTHDGKEYFTAAELPGVVGKEMAERLLSQPKTAFSDGKVHQLNLADDNFKLGGQGMREYYDKRYPAALEKELRRIDPEWKGRETDVALRKEDGSGMFHYGEAQGDVRRFNFFPLTPKIREEVRKGLPLFSLLAALTAASPAVQRQMERANRPPLEEDSPFRYD